jgi:hypothetical protein
MLKDLLQNLSTGISDRSDQTGGKAAVQSASERSGFAIFK